MCERHNPDISRFCNMTDKNSDKRRKLIERTSVSGLLLVCAALVSPFAVGDDMESLSLYKWIYTAGALIYLVARLVGAMDDTLSPRMRRIRRMEFWAGVSFCLGAAMWFYTETRIGSMAGPLAVLRSTIMFTLAGAVIQVISAQLGYSVEKKEKSEQ